MSPGPLDGVRVIEHAALPTAYCGKLLADMGAEVVLIEPPGGSSLRHIGPFHGNTPEIERALPFWHYNTNKRSLVLDAGNRADHERYAALLDGADVVLDAGPGAITNPSDSVIHASITPFGLSGPHNHWRGSDLIGQASGGMAFVNGFRELPPLQGFGLQAYHTAGIHAAIAILLALLQRRRSGGGQNIDVSIQECVANCVEHASSMLHFEGRVAERQGALHWTRYFRTGPCRDGHIMHCTLGDWTTLSEWVKASGKADSLNDPLWDDPAYRKTECVRLFDILDGWAADLDAADLVGTAQLLRLPFAVVQPPEQVAQNEQLIERAFFVDSDHHDGARIRYPGAPYVMSASPWQLATPAPRLNQHDRYEWGIRPATAEPPSPHAPTPSSPQGRSLDGIRILDFTWVVAGPLCTRILADHGAEVIKVERPNATDFGSRRGGLTGNLNRGKHSLMLNMASPRGVALARDLAARCDVVVDNFSARVMRNWGLDYEGLRRLNPGIITLSMSGFGHSGPHRDHVSYGPTLQALSGQTHLMRHPGHELSGWGFSYSDMAGGCSGALAVLLALWHRQRTGEGQFIDLSQFENLVSLAGPALTAFLNGVSEGIDAVGNLSQEGAAVPHGIYRCADETEAGLPVDRWCAIAVFGDADWQGLRRAMGNPSWMNDPRCATNDARLQARHEIDGWVEAWTRGRNAEDVASRLQQHGIAASVVANAHDLCRRDPHLQARGYWQRVVTPEGETLEFDGIPFKMSNSPGRVDAAGPLLGEHTDSILQRILGLSRAAIDALRNDGTVG